MPATTPAFVIVADAGFPDCALHVPPDVMAVNVTVVVGEQILWSLPALGFTHPWQGDTVTDTVSEQSPNV